MKTAADRIAALMAIHPPGFDLSLERITRLLERLDRPQDRLPPVIHVAGTNGKGSTIAFCRAIMEAAGLSVHVDTSPHLVNWHERFRIGEKGGPGRLVEDAVLSDAIGRASDANNGDAITLHEILTAVMFLLFAEHPADACLVEVGLGGRFDASNVMDDVAVSVITPVSLDHEAHLGDTIAKIAFEKAGIIRRKTPLVISEQSAEALAVIEQQAAKHLAAAQTLGVHFNAIRENGRLLFQDETALLDLPLPRLCGEHQVINAATAIATMRTFCAGRDITLDETAIATGLKTVDWPGRMQRLPKGRLFHEADTSPDIWLDGGHNPGAAMMIARHMADLEERDPRPLVLICGMLNTKDPAGYFREFTSLATHVITVPITSSKSGVEPTELADVARGFGFETSVAGGLMEAAEFAVELADGDTPPRILVSGSLYLVGDALALNGTPPT